MKLTRLAIWATWGVFLCSLGADYTTLMFWCGMALLWAFEHVTRMSVYEELTETEDEAENNT